MVVRLAPTMNQHIEALTAEMQSLESEIVALKKENARLKALVSFHHTTRARPLDAIAGIASKVLPVIPFPLDS